MVQCKQPLHPLLPQQTADIGGQLLILAGSKEQLVELLAGHSAAQQLLVDALQALDQGLKVAARTPSRIFLLRCSGHNTPPWAALAVAKAEQLLKAVLQVQLAAPAKALGKGMATALPSLTWAKV